MHWMFDTILIKWFLNQKPQSIGTFDKHMRKYEISRRYINDKYLLWSTFWIYSMKMLLKYFCPQVHTIDESSSSWVQSVWWLSESILFYDRYYFFYWNTQTFHRNQTIQGRTTLECESESVVAIWWSLAIFFHR